MKKYHALFLCMCMAVSIALAGCGKPDETVSAEEDRDTASQAVLASEEESNINKKATELRVRFGDEGNPFILRLEDNSTAEAIAGYVGTTDWRLPIYSYDESEVMQYYDIPSRYEIPDNSIPVTQAYAGEVFYSDPNRIILYYHDAEISEEYTKVGTFEATEEFVSAVENNPVQEGWGNKLVLITAGEQVGD